MERLERLERFTPSDGCSWPLNIELLNRGKALNGAQRLNHWNGWNTWNDWNRRRVEEIVTSDVKKNFKAVT